MIEDYEELPCPETNTFEVGELVRVYDGACRFPGKIVEKGIEINKVLEIGRDNSVGIPSYYSYKQLRPLKKKEPPKPSVWWVYPNERTYETVCSSRSASPPCRESEPSNRCVCVLDSDLICTKCGFRPEGM